MIQVETIYSPDCVERSDGSRYYSEAYLKEMMHREYMRGVREGSKEVIHRAVIVWDGFKEAKV